MQYFTKTKRKVLFSFLFIHSFIYLFIKNVHLLPFPLHSLYSPSPSFSSPKRSQGSMTCVKIRAYFYSAPLGTLSKIHTHLIIKISQQSQRNLNNSLYYMEPVWVKVRVQQQHKPKSTNSLKCSQLNHHWVKKKIKDILAFNENESTTYPN